MTPLPKVLSSHSGSDARPVVQRGTSAQGRKRAAFSPTHRRIAKRLRAADFDAAVFPDEAQATQVSQAQADRPPLDPRRAHSRHRRSIQAYGHDRIHSHSLPPRSTLLEVHMELEDVVDVDIEVGSLSSSVAGSRSSTVASGSASTSTSASSNSASSIASTGPSSSSPSVSASASASGSASVSASGSASTSASASASTSASASASASASTSASASASASASTSASASRSRSASATASASASLSSPSSSLTPTTSHTVSGSATTPSRLSKTPSSSLQGSSHTSVFAPSSSSLPPTLPTTTPLSSPTDSTSACDCDIASSTVASPSKSGVLNTATSAADAAFAHNVGGIVGVALGGLLAVILGVFIVFFMCKRYQQRRAPAGSAPPMQQTGNWRPPLAGDDDSVASADHAETSVGHASTSGHTSSGHMGFTQAGATLAMEPGLWYSGAAVQPEGLTSPSSHGHSSQSDSHSGPLTGGSSAASHGLLLPATASSDFMHSSASGHGISSADVQRRPPMPTPPSSFERTSAKGFFGRLRGSRSSGSDDHSRSTADRPQVLPVQAQAPLTRKRTPPSPHFVPPVPHDPSSPPLPSSPRPSSLLNPPVPVLSLPPVASSQPPRPPWAPWAPSTSQPLPSPTPTEELRAPEGLLRPIIPLTHSTRTLGDHVDYSRPIAHVMRPGPLRMDSGNTWVSSLDEVVDSEEGDEGHGVGLAS